MHGDTLVFNFSSTVKDLRPNISVTPFKSIIIREPIHKAILPLSQNCSSMANQKAFTFSGRERQNWTHSLPKIPNHLHDTYGHIIPPIALRHPQRVCI